MNGRSVRRSLACLFAIFIIFLLLSFDIVLAQVIIPGANVNVSVRGGNQTEVTVVVNPTNTQQVFVSSNDETVNPGIFAARSADGGATWTRGTMATGPGGDGLPAACCDPSASWDQFGNLFLTYLNQTATQVELLLSTDGGATFTSIGPIATGTVDQPSTVTTGAGAVWVTFRDNAGTISARGAQVTGLGTVGAFNAAQVAPGSASGNFGDIAIGPAGQVMVTYQIPSGGQGLSTIFINLDPDGLGPAGFGANVTATTMNVGGFDFIPSQPDRSVDSEAGLAYDRSGGPRNGRVYLVYTDEIPDESNDMDIFVRFSDSDGAAGTWSAPVRVNDDATINSQFLPRIALDQTNGNFAVTWHDARADGGTGPADADGPNNDAQLWGTISINSGANFLPNVQISAGTSDEDGADPPAGGFADIDYGDYIGADFFNGNFYTAWADNSNSTGDNPNGTLNRFDVYFARSAFVNQSDLSITKADSPDPVIAGNNLAYTITVTNNGPVDATGVTVTDTLLAGVTFVSATPTQGSCTGVVSCALGTLPNGASASVTIVVTVDPAAPCGTITNTSSVTAIEVDPNTADNSATENSTVICRADLSIAKADSPDPVIAGNNLTYDLTATNNGPNDATGVTVTDTLPAGVTFSSAIPSQGSCSESGGTVTCGLLNITNGASATITINVIVNSSTPSGTITNAANVFGNEADPNNADNIAIEDTTVILVTDLSISKADTPDPVIAGSNLTYDITVTNNGPSNATGVIATDTLPAEVTFVSATPSQGTCTPAGSIITCDLTNLASGASATITIIATVDPAAPGGTITNTANVTGNETDPDPANNTASVGTAVIGLANLSITKSDSPDPVTAGDNLTYTLTVTNNGPGNATGVMVTDTLPAGVSLVSATPSQGSCTAATCDLGNLGTGATASITLEVAVDSAHPGGTVTNTASVAGNEMDPDIADNTASEDTTVRFLVQIDIRPRNPNNIINPRSRGQVSVAILSTPDFDAPNDVDRTSLTFGRTGNEASLDSCRSRARDVNGDGLLDLICNFNIQLTGFQVGDTEGVLRGETVTGLLFEGRDSVMVVPPRPRR